MEEEGVVTTALRKARLLLPPPPLSPCLLPRSFVAVGAVAFITLIILPIILITPTNHP